MENDGQVDAQFQDEIHADISGGCRMMQTNWRAPMLIQSSGEAQDETPLAEVQRSECFKGGHLMK